MATLALYGMDVSHFPIYELNNNNEVDVTPPVLNSLSIEDSSLSPGDALIINYSATEETGISVASFQFLDELNKRYTVQDYNDDGQLTFNITSEMVNGEYRLDNISLTDTTVRSNSISYRPNGDAYVNNTSFTDYHDLDFTLLNFNVTLT